MAIDLMGDTIPGCPPLDKLFVSMQKLACRCILYLMANKEAAEWMRQEDVKRGFTDHYGILIKVRKQGFRVICQSPLTPTPATQQSRLSMSSWQEPSWRPST